MLIGLYRKTQFVVNQWVEDLYFERKMQPIKVRINQSPEVFNQQRRQNKSKYKY